MLKTPGSQLAQIGHCRWRHIRRDARCSGFILNSVAKKSVRAAYIPFHQSVENARQATAGELTFATNTRDKRLEEASKKRKDRNPGDEGKIRSLSHPGRQKRDTAIEALTADYTKQFADIKVKRDKLAAESSVSQTAKVAEVKEQQAARSKRPRTSMAHAWNSTGGDMTRRLPP